ncbi:hypothetical protein [Streptomyces sp. A012304]|uniref:hypothetical protein n=1 Tax=Streptomyces sp. A012304 TaxID=375446 RepID=UPI00222E6D7E|nr:hypothetical protein [Streptomyces sp. A012304]GKQ35493.1 hypothetical protein ALMP_20360 [Streptomyces sp. A012304]
MTGVLLHARSRALPGVLAALAGTVVLAWWAMDRLGVSPDPSRRVPVVVLAPLLAAAVIGGSLHSPSEELDRTAVRRWWPWRLAQLLAPTAVAAALLSLAVLGDPTGFGPAAMVRNTLGWAGVTAVAAVTLGARLSWLPAFAYGCAVCAASDGVRGRAVTVWAWPAQPGHATGAWLVAGAVFALGTALYTAHGARPEEPRR